MGGGIGECRANADCISQIHERHAACRRAFPDYSRAGGILEDNLKGLVNLQERAPNRLCKAELKRIPVVASMAAEDWRRLEECGLPEALIHGDLNESNLFLTNRNESKLIDWSSPGSVIRSSFWGIPSSTYDRQHRMFNDRARLREAYIQPWLSL